MKRDPTAGKSRVGAADRDTLILTTSQTSASSVTRERSATPLLRRCPLLKARRRGLRWCVGHGQIEPLIAGRSVVAAQFGCALASVGNPACSRPAGDRGAAAACVMPLAGIRS